MYGDENPVLLTKENCAKCDYVKQKMPKMELEIIDTESVKGITLVEYHNLKGQTLPILVNSGDVYIGAFKSLRALQSLSESPG